MLRKLAAVSMLALGVQALPFLANAQDYPTQPIRIIVPFAPGAGNDLLGRLTADALTQRMGQTVFVENKAGAGSAIGIDLVAKSKPDGYTILWTASDGITILPAVKTSVPYKVPDDFTFIARITQLPFFVAVNPDLPIKSLQELIAYGKANPGKLRYGTAGVAGGPHMATALLAHKAGIEMTHVPYQGIAPAMTALIGGFVDVVLAAPSSVKPYADGGKVRLLAMSGKERHPNFPDVPTWEQAGLPLNITVFYGILAPAGTPEPILARLRKEIGGMLADPKIVERLQTLGYKPEFIAGDEFKKFLVNDLEQWKTTAKAANIAVAN
jgi:tripartite-type tricarboxylate transporter receptor subunit TctC